MVPTGADLETIKASAVDYLQSIGQRWAARILKISSLALSTYEDDGGKINDAIIEIRADVKAPIYVEGDKIPDSEKEWVEYYLPRGLGWSLNKTKRDTGPFLHVNNLIIEWEDNKSIPENI